MTSETASNLAEAFREHRDAFGAPITFGQHPEITAIVGEAEFGRELVGGGGGFAETGDLACTLLLSDLPSAPVISTPATFNGRTFRVNSVSVPPGSLIGEYNLRPAKR